ncbi:stage III sporulation protein AB [Ruminococcus sp. Marseille-P6503]|uniref:stage III sporulation protein AB n=1 Tax=Ruminococcus sp. Marseille-P6503 TaxID=2364796 RepID=UPI000F52CA15|nr:stage III sporulation protein AB [Ruminococcus sp. Marseille-P6503]
MVKMIGLALILMSGGLIGITASDKVKLHGKALKKIIRLLEESEIMIKYNACTFSELLEHYRICDEIKDIDFIEQYSLSGEADIKEAVCGAVKRTGLELTEEEKHNLNSFFLELGSTDLEGQLAIISHYKEYFRECLCRADEETQAKCRLYKSMGILGGAFLAVILI